MRIIIENKLTIGIKDLINYSVVLYEDQKVQLSNKFIVMDILIFLRERFKNLLKDKKIRNDIVEAVESSHVNDDFLSLYKKCVVINKNISKDICRNIIGTYKRASNIIDQELKKKKDQITGQPESFLFKKMRKNTYMTKSMKFVNIFLVRKKESSMMKR